MELSKESKNIVDTEFEMIHAITIRIKRTKHNNSSDNCIECSAIAIYLKRGNDLSLEKDDYNR